jgi:hypothetical protein
LGFKVQKYNTKFNSFFSQHHAKKELFGKKKMFDVMGFFKRKLSTVLLYAICRVLAT